MATEQDPLPSSHEVRCTSRHVEYILCTCTCTCIFEFPSVLCIQSIEKKVASILPVFRVGTHAHPTVGYHCATQDGVYEILFDNTYSR